MPVYKFGNLPAHPTDFLPGTEGKLAVMEERAARGECLFHPQDAKLDMPGVVRARVMNDLGNRRDSWEIADEVDYRLRHPCDDFYGGDGDIFAD